MLAELNLYLTVLLNVEVIFDVRSMHVAMALYNILYVCIWCDWCFYFFAFAFFIVFCVAIVLWAHAWNKAIDWLISDTLDNSITPNIMRLVFSFRTLRVVAAISYSVFTIS